KILSVLGLPESFGYMQKRPGKNKRFSFSISFFKHFQYGACEALHVGNIISIGFSRWFSFSSDGGKIRPIRRHFIIYVYIGIQRLSAARGGELRKFIDKHLRELFYFFIRHGTQVRRKRNIKRIPTDCAGKMPL